MYKVKSGLGNRPHRPLFTSPVLLLALSWLFPLTKAMASFHFGRFFCRVNKTIVKMKQFRLHTYSLEVVCYVIANVCQNPYINCSLTTEWLETFFSLATRSVVLHWIAEHLCIAFANLRVCLWINLPFGLIGVIYLFGLWIRTGQNTWQCNNLALFNTRSNVKCTLNLRL